MPGRAAGYLPPVVAQLVADADKFVAKMQMARAMLAEFATHDATAHLNATTKPLESTLLTARTELLAFAKQVSRAELGADAKPFWAEIADLRAKLAAMSPFDIRLDADLAGVEARMAALRGSFALAQVGSLMSAADQELLQATGAGGRKNAGPGLMQLIGMGGLFGFATMGSLASLAGLGLEHAILTALGLAGSLAGAGLGAGAIGLGMLGTAGVGMGSDMIVGKSTLADTQALYQAYANLSKAVAVYGANSTQAKNAQAALNYQIASLGGASKVGVAAEIKLAQTASALNTQFDQLTQQARANFINGLALPLMDVAKTYLPLVAGAAQENFRIMGAAMKPLFAWLKGPEAIGIFNDLENQFQRNLPTGVAIFTQAIELLLKTIDHIATSSNFGGFMQKILGFVTRLNGTGFEHFMGQIDTVIGLFHVWAAFIVALGRDIFYMFAQAAGLAAGPGGIIPSLTIMLDKLGQWERSTSGAAAMHSIFEAHKEEILALLQLIPLLVKTLGPIYLTLAPVLTQVVTAMAMAAAAVINFLTHLGGGVGTVMTWVIGLGLLEMKAHTIGNAFKLVGLAVDFIKGAQLAFLALTASMDAADIAAYAAANGIAATGVASAALAVKNFILAGAQAVATAATWAYTTAATAGLAVTSGLLLGIPLLITGLILLATHWNEVTSALHNAWVKWGAIIQVILAFLGPIGMAIDDVILLVTHLRELFTAMSHLPIVGGFFKQMAADVSGSARSMGANVSSSMKQTASSVQGSFNSMAIDGQTKMAMLTGSVDGYAQTMGLNVGANTANMKNALIANFNQMFGQGSAIARALSTQVNSSTGQMKQFGVTNAEAMRLQMIDQINQLYGKGSATAKALVAQVNNQFLLLPGEGMRAGQGLVSGLVVGIQDMSAQAIAAAYGVGLSAANAIKRGAFTASPSKLTIEVGRNLAEGLIVGMNDRLMAAMAAGTSLGRAVAGAIQPQVNTPRLGFAGAGVGNISINMPITVQIPSGAAGSPQQYGNTVGDEVEVRLRRVMKSLLGGSYLPGQGLP